MKYLNNIDLLKNELQNARIQNLSSAPSSPVAGQVYFDTTLTAFRAYSGSVWVTLVDAVPNTLYDANTILAANSDNTPAALTVGASTIVGRGAAGNIAALTASQAKTVLAITPSDVSGFDTQVRTSRLDQMAAPTAAVSMNSQRITNVTDPSSAQDAATKAYVDSVATGLDVKASVRVATTANGTLASAFQNGSSVDGVTLATGNRILIKNQSSGAENGIYTVNASGAPTRATDADSAAEVTPGMFTFVEEGTTNADTGWVMTNNGAITLGTTALVFAQFSGGASYTAGNGLTLTGNTIDVVGTSNRISVAADSIDIDAAYVGQTSITTLGTVATGTWSATTIALNKGGTGATTAAAARTNLVAAGWFVSNVGDGSSTTVTVTHNLGTRDVVAQLYDAATYDTVFPDTVRATTNTVQFVFAVAPANNAYRAVIMCAV